MTDLPNVDAFVGKLNHAMDIISAQVITHGPEAAQLMLNLIRFRGIFDLLVGFVISIITIIAAINFPKFMKKAAEADYNDEGPYVFMVIACCFTVIVGTLMGGHLLLDFDNWCSAFFPAGELALKALHSVDIQI